MIRLRVIRNDGARLERALPQIKRAVHRAMARKFWEMTRANFGTSGRYRPSDWAALSESYLKKLKRKSFGTPLVPTLLRAGTLINSIRLRADERAGVVWTDIPYAGVHQFGEGHVPARPYFPVFGGKDGSQATLTDKAELEIRIAAGREMDKWLP